MCQQCPCSGCIINECTVHLCIIPSIFQLENWAFVRWKKHTVNYTRSLFAWGHFVWDRQLCYSNLQQLYRKSKVLTKDNEFLMLMNIPLWVFTWHISLSAGASVPSEDLRDMMSIPVQCTQKVPTEKPAPQSTTAHDPAVQCEIGGQSFSDLLSMDMSKLHMDGACQRDENIYLAHNIAPLISQDCLRWEEAHPKVSKNLLQDDHLSGDKPMLTVGVRRGL